MRAHLNLIYISLLLIPHLMWGTAIIKGDSTVANPTIFTFNDPVSAKVFDPFMGTLYVALATSPNGTDQYTIAKLPRSTVGAAQNFLPIAPSTLKAKAIDFLALATSPGNTSPILAVVPVNSQGQLSQTEVFDLSATGTLTNESISLLSTNTMHEAPGGPISGIAGMTANQNYIFLATSPVGDFFGTNGSGIAVVNINLQSLLLDQVAAVPGDSAIKSVLLDGTIEQVSIGTDEPTITPDRVALHWDYKLQRLYVGLQEITDRTVGDGAKAIVVGSMNSSGLGKLTLTDFVPTGAIDQDDYNKIVIVERGATGPQPTNLNSANLAIAQIRSMHTTTGASYLIVNGGNGIITTNATDPDGTIGNMIFALPLVDVNDPTNPTQGTLADKNSFDAVNHRFATPATTSAGLTSATDPAALVGAGPLPIQPQTPVSGVGSGILNTSGAGLYHDTLDILVVKDAVYVAISTAQSDVDDSGIFYSQAEFNADGSINQWTPWKRIAPFNFFPNIPQPYGTTRFVNVDPVLDKIIGINAFPNLPFDSDQPQGFSVRSTNWQKGIFASPLPQAVSTALPSGCFSVLDLGQTTAGLGPETPDRYALFGGKDTVAFALVTQSLEASPPYDSAGVMPDTSLPPIPAPEMTITNFSSAQNFLVTSLPSAGGVKVLEYSRRKTGSGTNFFFAGSNTGLFVFSVGGSGFDVSTLSTLDQPPFSAGSWQRIDSIPGAVLDIKTSGNSLYVLTVQLQANGIPLCQVFNIPYQTTIAAMFAPGNKAMIAQSGFAAPGSDLSMTNYFYALQIMIAPNDTEQLMLATNNGLFMSAASGGVSTAANQADAVWTLQRRGFYTGMAGMDVQQPTTVWPISLEDPTSQKIFNRSSIHQVSQGAFLPEPFNADNNSAPQFTALNPISFFWTDGARRLFIMATTGGSGLTPNRMYVLPYDTSEHNVLNPTVISDMVLDSITRFYWLKQLGGTGLLLAGTNNGVVSLE